MMVHGNSSQTGINKGQDQSAPEGHVPAHMLFSPVPSASGSPSYPPVFHVHVTNNYFNQNNIRNQVNINMDMEVDETWSKIVDSSGKAKPRNTTQPITISEDDEAIQELLENQSRNLLPNEDSKKRNHSEEGRKVRGKGQGDTERRKKRFYEFCKEYPRFLHVRMTYSDLIKDVPKIEDYLERYQDEAQVLKSCGCVER